jgi:hypothetical protein
MKRSSGSILLFALMMVAMMVLLTQQLMRGVLVGSSFASNVLDREKATSLALGGIQIAAAQLIQDSRDEKGGQEEKSEKGEKKEEKEAKGLRAFLKRVLPYVNRWKEFNFQEKVDGIEGNVKICISCERGKININEVFDFKKMEFKKEYENLFKNLEIRGRLPAGEMYNRLLDFFKKRKRKLDDVSELLAISGFQTLDIFYRPPLKAMKGKKNEPNVELALQDLFTTWTSDEKIDPMWLSDSLCAILQFRRPRGNDAHEHKEQFGQFVQKFKKEMAQDWGSNLQTLELLYDKIPKEAEQSKGIFTKEFGPKVFSVLSCGKVGQMEQQLLAVIRLEEVAEQGADKQNEKSQEEKKGEAEQSGKSQKKPKKTFKVLRVYWL